MLGYIAQNQNNILAQATDVWKKTTHNLDDDNIVVALQALHQHFFCYYPLCDYNIPGPINIMSTILLWWDLTNSKLLSYFNINIKFP